MKVFTLEELIELLRAETQSLDEDRMNFLDFITPEMEKKLNLIDYNEFEANLHEGALLFKEQFSEIYSLHPLKDLLCFAMKKYIVLQLQLHNVAT